jgi:hypothetical protein
VFGRSKEQARKREQRELRARADGAMLAGQGVYNSNPWAFALGIAGAVFATLYLLTRLLSQGEESEVPAAPTPSDEIPIEIE